MGIDLFLWISLNFFNFSELVMFLFRCMLLYEVTVCVLRQSVSGDHVFFDFILCFKTLHLELLWIHVSISTTSCILMYKYTNWTKRPFFNILLGANRPIFLK